MTARSALSAFAAALVAAFVLLPVAPASAASGVALVSLDGVNFSQTPTGSLFRPGYLAIPGDRLTGTLWVRNDSTVDARLTLAVTNVTGDADLLGALTLVHTPNEWLPVSPSVGHCGQMTVGRSIPAGSTSRIDLSLVVDDSLTQSQNDAGRFSVRALLSDAAAPTPAGDACNADTVVSAFEGGNRPQLPTMASTGVSPTVSLLLAGAAIVLGGLLAARTRRMEDHA